MKAKKTHKKEFPDIVYKANEMVAQRLNGEMSFVPAKLMDLIDAERDKFYLHINKLEDKIDVLKELLKEELIK